MPDINVDLLNYVIWNVIYLLIVSVSSLSERDTQLVKSWALPVCALVSKMTYINVDISIGMVLRRVRMQNHMDWISNLK